MLDLPNEVLLTCAAHEIGVTVPIPDVVEGIATAQLLVPGLDVDLVIRLPGR